MLINFLAAFASIYLLKIIGRKTLMAGTLIIMSMCSCMMLCVISFSNSICVILVMLVFIIAFELGPGPICWLYQAEITNDKAMGIATSINWTLTLVMSVSVPPLIQSLKNSWFLVFTMPCFFGFIFAVGIMEETRGKTEIEVLALYRTDKDLILERAKKDD